MSNFALRRREFVLPGIVLTLRLTQSLALNPLRTHKELALCVIYGFCDSLDKAGRTAGFTR